MGVGIASRLMGWQVIHGRHDLPWQRTRDPYRVWLSEVMLQQTQVSTVVTYFDAFIKRFPTVCELAGAEQDEVLAMWSGLGYYSRARNLHRCAQIVTATYAGEFPQRASVLQTLPGIGRSTAAAISAICFGERVAILDGNVKRVLARALGFAGDLSKLSNERVLWELAESELPEAELVSAMPRYTQAVMDLGATVCMPRKPKCGECPLSGLCIAQKQGRQSELPVKTRKSKRSSQSIWLLKATAPDGSVWLHQRPAGGAMGGVWSGLYCFEMHESLEALQATLTASLRDAVRVAPAFKHVLTHKDLYLYLVHLEAPHSSRFSETGRWFAANEWLGVGLPAPIKRLLA